MEGPEESLESHVLAAATNADVEEVVVEQENAPADIVEEPNLPDVEVAMVEAQGEEEAAGAVELPNDQEEETEAPRRKKRATGKKRVRRVGTFQPRKEHKTENNAQPLPAAIAIVAMGSGNFNKVQSKHDEKWNAMFAKLVAYKQQHNSTMVPQCYDQDSRLGRWVHYQRVEYWIYQSSGKGKINQDRINRLESIGFEWDPQRGKWNIMYQKLLRFVEEFGHAKVPKGFSKDRELANWVRNQRLEYANMQRGKRTRMTQERMDKLNAIGFKWSTSMPYRAKNPAPKATIEATVEAATAAAEAAEGSKEDDNKAKGEQPAALEPKEDINVEAPADPFAGV